MLKQKCECEELATEENSVSSRNFHVKRKIFTRLWSGHEDATIAKKRRFSNGLSLCWCSAGRQENAYMLLYNSLRLTQVDLILAKYEKKKTVSTFDGKLNKTHSNTSAANILFTKIYLKIDLMKNHNYKVWCGDRFCIVFVCKTCIHDTRFIHFRKVIWIICMVTLSLYKCLKGCWSLILLCWHALIFRTTCKLRKLNCIN